MTPIVCFTLNLLLCCNYPSELNELISVQANELKLDEDIRCSETRALQERKVLASLLDNIADGIICIDSTGIIQRFK